MELSDSSLVIVGGEKRRGRPKAEIPCVSVSAWIPVSTADRLIKLALKHDVSVSAVVATLLTTRSKRMV